MEGDWMDDNIFSMIVVGQQKQELQKVVACNEYTQKFGVCLSEQEAIQLLQSRKENLREQERIEFGEGILSKLIFNFCDSPYIYQDNYLETIEALQEIFYLYKNESLDELSDDELITYMKVQFDGDCQGSLEFLEDTSLEKFCREIREGCHKFMGIREEE